MLLRIALHARLYCALLLLSANSLAGVTVITHGFNSDIDDWVITMARAVARYPNLGLTNTTCYEIFFEQNAQGEYVPRQRKLDGGDPRNADSGEIIVKLNWSQLAGDLSGVAYSTTNVAPSVASTLSSTSFLPELGGRPLIELPLHLVGHSRGGSLICEVAKVLGEQGVWVDHVTTLDPHPLNNEYDDRLLTSVIDGPAVPYVNVLFADNYYQMNNSFLGLDPSGQFVIGAYNRYLDVRFGGYGGFAAQHSNVHLWYHGTIDWRTPISDSAATITALERRDWWTAVETNGASAGFYFSLIGGGNRLSEISPAGGTNRVKEGFNQMWDLGAGVSANRFALPGNTGLWPNLLTLNVASTNLVALENGRNGHSIESGADLPLRFQYQYGQTQVLLLTVFLDRDFNPYSANELVLQTRTLAATGTSAAKSSTAAIGGSQAAAPGVYAMAAAITDGNRTRYLYAPELLQITASRQPPEIRLATVRTNLFEARVAGAIGQRVVIEQSSDLVNWAPVLTNTLSGADWIFEQEFRPDSKVRIYRAKLAE